MTGIQQIARVTGLSKSTVSRALRGLPGVSAETTLTVKNVADELGYIPSSAAAGLATGRHHAVGVVVPTINRWFYMRALEGIDAELRRAGYDLILFNLGRPDGFQARGFHRSMLRQRVDALVLLSLAFDDTEREQLHLTEYPVVIIGGPGPGIRHIGIDDDAAARLATRHLLDLGHRAIAHIGGYDEAGMNVAVPQERRRGFIAELATEGIAARDDWMLDGGFTFAGGYRAMQALLAGGDRPTAVFATSDEMAFGALTALRETGLRVPDDVSVIGIDGHEYGPVVGLTTIAQSPSDQGATATRALLSELAGGPRVDQFPAADIELVDRGSTAPPRGAEPAARP
ncbi:LacI family DNA-binding transcriptional regulator [Frigoribacterium sp. 2-23]|uniref:LacI family DNA-binding transcriptional regulator n=1 Tax=Frigoribacterium sp. 2-23 TaxID=3415006 RepID=UPI003C6EAD22